MQDTTQNWNIHCLVGTSCGFSVVSQLYSWVLTRRLRRKRLEVAQPLSRSSCLGWWPAVTTFRLLRLLIIHDWSSPGARWWWTIKTATTTTPIIPQSIGLLVPFSLRPKFFVETPSQPIQWKGSLGRPIPILLRSTLPLTTAVKKSTTDSVEHRDAHQQIQPFAVKLAWPTMACIPRPPWPQLLALHALVANSVQLHQGSPQWIPQMWSPQLMKHVNWKVLISGYCFVWGNPIPQEHIIKTFSDYVQVSIPSAWHILTNRVWSDMVLKCFSISGRRNLNKTSSDESPNVFVVLGVSDNLAFFLNRPTRRLAQESPLSCRNRGGQLRTRIRGTQKDRCMITKHHDMYK